jgi:hypothetical protein
VHEYGVNGDPPSPDLEELALLPIFTPHLLVVNIVLDIDHEKQILDQRLDLVCLLRQCDVAVL